MSKIIGPIEMSIKVHVSDGEMDASGDYSFPAGQIPDEQKVLAAIGAVMKATGMQPIEDREFFNAVVTKRITGRAGNFAVPAEFEYDDNQLAASAMTALEKVKSK